MHFSVFPLTPIRAKASVKRDADPDPQTCICHDKKNHEKNLWPHGHRTPNWSHIWPDLVQKWINAIRLEPDLVRYFCHILPHLWSDSVQVWLTCLEGNCNKNKKHCHIDFLKIVLLGLWSALKVVNLVLNNYVHSKIQFSEFIFFPNTFCSHFGKHAFLLTCLANSTLTLYVK